MRFKVGVLEQTRGLHLCAEFHLNVSIASASGGQKPQFGANCNFGGSCTDPLLPMRAKFGVLLKTYGVRLRAKFRLDQFILSPSGCENPQFWPYFGLRHLVVSPIGNSLSNGIKIVSVLQRLHGEIGRKISDVQKPDEQTNTQKTQRAPPNWHSDSRPRARSCTSKTFAGLTHSYAVRGAENLGITRPRQLKMPITLQPLEQIQRNFSN